MIKLLADENLHNILVRGVFLQEPSVDFCRVQDVGLRGIDDPALLQWAAEQDRIVVSHDTNTLIQFAQEQVQKGEKMPGLFCVSPFASFSQVIDDLVVLVRASEEGEWEGQVLFIPL